ncbi:MAG TPA: tetratricopeptide repeat protein [Candidatus Acidoferrales bacterium]|nr:tetratricopeptide repeat protein [Candidatus Acidoferrales bacterium]
MDQQAKSLQWRLRQWSRGAVLLLALAVLAALFILTGLAAGYYRDKRAELAQQWFARGDRALKGGRPREAIDDLRNALSYAPDDAAYQLRLAQALAAANQLDEAETYLSDLWARQPGSGEINLELARLEARKGGGDAARYYDNAIYGVWETDPVERRWQTRLELFAYWRAHGNLGQAQAELLAMAAATPEDDYRRHSLIGQLQLASGNPRQALTQFQAALRANRRWPPALEGAGEAEFAIGDFRGAIRYLDAAVRADRGDKDVAEKLLVARLVLSDDPFAIGLDEKQRMALAAAAFDQAQAELRACAYQRGVDVEAASGENDFVRAWTQGKQLGPLLRRLRHKPENIVQVMDFVFSAENLAAARCGPLEGKDQALWLIGKQHHLAEASAGAGR